MKGASIKSTETQIAMLSCRHVEPLQDYPVQLHFEWGLKNRRKDADNVRFSAKMILDGMVKAGVLKDDSLKYVDGFSDSFIISKQPYVKVFKK